jgi:hypothetical protein
MREIFTEDHDLEMLQQSVKEALADLQESLAYPFGKPTAPVRSRYVALMGDAVMADPTGGAFTVILQYAKETDLYKVITVKNNSASTNAITIVAAQDGTIDGAASATITTAWGKLTFQAVAVNAYVTM